MAKTATTLLPIVPPACDEEGNSLALAADIADTGCSLKVYRKEFPGRLKLFTGLHRFLPTLFRMEGAPIVQVPVNHRPRAAGRGKHGLADRLTGQLADLLAVRWMMKRHVRYRSEELS